MTVAQLSFMGDTLDEQFWNFHQNNPEVYRRLRDLALEAVAKRGGKRIGMKMLFEVVRWEHFLATTGDLKLNNNYTSRYARLLMESEPKLEGAFETRRLHR